MTDQIAAVRAFNRRYTGLIGVLQEGVFDTPYTLTEARLLYEIGQARAPQEPTEVIELRHALDLDAGYLSRILARFEADGLLIRERSAVDARRQTVRLTDRGIVASQELGERSNGSESADPRTDRVLDIGAGTGRNALALARRGHPVDVVEMTPKFADIVRSEAERESLDVRVIQTDDVSATMDSAHSDYQLIVVSEVVPDFRTTQELRGMFELAARCLAPGGRLVFNAFLACRGYTPENAPREFGQQCNSMIFTRDEMTIAADLLPLEFVADDSVVEYEKTHLPEGSWPPTNWFENWASGLDLFDVAPEESPIELRWLVYQRAGWGDQPEV